MSQITKIFDGTIAPDVETLSGDTGGVVHPDAGFNILLQGGPGIYTIGDPANNKITIGRTTFITNTLETVDGAVVVPAIITTFPLNAFDATYTIEGKIAAYDKTDDAGAGYTFSAAARVTSSVATLIGVNYGVDFEEVAMAAADYTVSAVGNDLLVTVTGIANKTIDWACDFDYVIALKTP